MNRNGRVNEKQRRLAKIMVTGAYETKGEAVLEAGYTENVSRIPKVPMSTMGFLQCVVEEATKVGNNIDRMNAELEMRDLNDFSAPELVNMMKTLSETQKNIMQSLPQQAKKPQDIHVIDLD